LVVVEVDQIPIKIQRLLLPLEVLEAEELKTQDHLEEQVQLIKEEPEVQLQQLVL
tara:strand:+ start:228 stop:392 length:165 start_codon:yes stop_codon:yes gene_type:complete